MDKDKCECDGIFEYEGIVLMSNHPQYPYKCNKCGKRIIKIPQMRYEYEWK